MPEEEIIDTLLENENPKQSMEDRIKPLLGKPVKVQWQDITYNDRLTPEDLDDPEFLADMVKGGIISSYGRLIGIVNGHLLIAQDHSAVKESSDCTLLCFPLSPVVKVVELIEKKNGAP